MCSLFGSVHGAVMDLFCSGNSTGLSAWTDLRFRRRVLQRARQQHYGSGVNDGRDLNVKQIVPPVMLQLMLPNLSNDGTRADWERCFDLFQNFWSRGLHSCDVRYQWHRRTIDSRFSYRRPRRKTIMFHTFLLSRRRSWLQKARDILWFKTKLTETVKNY